MWTFMSNVHIQVYQPSMQGAMLNNALDPFQKAACPSAQNQNTEENKTQRTPTSLFMPCVLV